MDMLPLVEFNERHNLTFRDLSLLQQAFVHRSFVNEQSPDAPDRLQDNERLEFLGDSVLSFVVSDHLYTAYPEAKEGVLTHLRTVVVRREALAKLAQELEMGSLLLVGIGEEESGGRTRLATLCAAFEALVGALFMDQGIEKVRAFLMPRILSLLADIEPQTTPKDPKSRFQEWSQRNLGITPRYRVVDSSGPDHARLFVSQVTLKGEPVGIGTGRSKQDASQAAAATALYRAGEYAPEYVADEDLEEKYNMREPWELEAVAAPAPG